jgi:hypothetical protein
MHRAGEAQPGQPVDEVPREMLALRKPLQLGLGEARLLQAAIRNPRRSGSLRTKNSNTAISVIPCSRYDCNMVSW